MKCRAVFFMFMANLCGCESQMPCEKIEWSVYDNVNSNVLWVNSYDDIWGAGNGVIEHWNGYEWSVALEEVPAISFDYIVAFGLGDIWLFGTQRVSDEEIESIRHWNGTDWIEMGSGSESWIKGAWGSSSDDVWLIRSVPYVGDSILHWNGSELIEDMLHEKRSYRGIWGASGNNVWVTFDGHGAEPNGLYHYYGSNWETVSLDSEDVFYSDIWVSPDGDVWLAGGRVISHYDGNRWSHKKIDFSKYDSGAIVSRITGSSADDVWATGVRCKVVDGTEICLRGLVRIKGGRVCNYTSIDPEDPMTHPLWCSERDVWAPGYGSTMLRYEL